MIGGHNSASLNENSVLAFLTRTVSLDSKKCKKTEFSQNHGALRSAP